VFSIQAWDLAVISSAKQPLQSVMLGVVTKKLQEVFGKHFLVEVLQMRCASAMQACVCGCVCVQGWPEPYMYIAYDHMSYKW
jgi:hypothetical protein